MDKTRCGMVSILGAPNAGKSTLLNALVGQKVAIVSPKRQTTRRKMLGIGIYDQTQAIFVDTPGIFGDPKRRLERALIHQAWRAMEDVNFIFLVVDSTVRLYTEVLSIIENLKNQSKPVILILNKIDLIPKLNLLKITSFFQELFSFENVFMVSAQHGDGVTDIQNYLTSHLPIGPWLFPEDQVNDISERFFAAEITREHAFRSLFDELPYSVYVETEMWESFRNGSIKISQALYVQRESQKSIVLGHKGRKIQHIGMHARKELEKLWDCQVHLFLYVKVHPNWHDDKTFYRMNGLEFNS